MYMYYFLGYQLKGDNSLKTEEEKRHRANNTFLLALDGDVDFQPDAIVKVWKIEGVKERFESQVVDLMKRNPRIGAACGRIHPTGSGYRTPLMLSIQNQSNVTIRYMQQYQKFEYAIGHWLQKATEHMLGCVLCRCDELILLSLVCCTFSVKYWLIR